MSTFNPLSPAVNSRALPALLPRRVPRTPRVNSCSFSSLVVLDEHLTAEGVGGSEFGDSFKPSEIPESQRSEESWVV